MIQKGAKLVTKVEDILDEIMHFIPSLKKQYKTETVELDSEERDIFNILDELLTTDEIVLRTGISITKVLEILLRLEIKGLITKIEGKYTRRI